MPQLESSEDCSRADVAAAPAIDTTPTAQSWLRLSMILVAHFVVDVYSAIVPPILGLLEVRCDLEDWQTASLLGVGSVTSGLSQPLAAWLSDRTDSRIFGAIGLLIAAVCLTNIGAATDYPTLLALFGIGSVGVGIFHPIGASTTGQVASSILNHGRSRGISAFFVAGMIGGVVGAIAAPDLVAREGGFESLRTWMVPGILLAGGFHLIIRNVPHRHVHAHKHVATSDHPTERRTMIVLLYITNAIRFTVNMTLYYLYVRWSQMMIGKSQPGLSADEIASMALPLNGRMTAMTIVGMGAGGLLAGVLIPTGSERKALIIVPIVLAPAIACIPFANETFAPALALMSGVAFASMIPVSLSVGQRLLPHRTSLVSGLLLGGAWSCAVVGPLAAEWWLQTFNLTSAFIATAALLLVSGLLMVGLKRSLLTDTAAVERAA